MNLLPATVVWPRYLALSCLGVILAVMTFVVFRSLFVAPQSAPIPRGSVVPIEMSHVGGVVNGNFTVLGSTPDHSVK